MLRRTWELLALGDALAVFAASAALVWLTVSGYPGALVLLVWWWHRSARATERRAERLRNER